MRFKIDVKESIGPFLDAEAGRILRAARYGLGSTGKWLRLTLQRDVPKTPRLNPFTGTINSIRGRNGMAKEVEVYRGRGKGRYRHGARKAGGGYYPAKRSTLTEPLTKMRGAIRVYVDDVNLRMHVGFLRPGLWAMMTRTEEGFTVNVTPRMRRMLFSIGVPLGGLSQLRIPGRPWVGKVYRERKSMIPVMFDAAMTRKLREGSR